MKNEEDEAAGMGAGGPSFASRVHCAPAGGRKPRGSYVERLYGLRVQRLLQFMVGNLGAHHDLDESLCDLAQRPDRHTARRLLEALTNPPLKCMQVIPTTNCRRVYSWVHKGVPPAAIVEALCRSFHDFFESAGKNCLTASTPANWRG
jgi:hypothetical protein